MQLKLLTTASIPFVVAGDGRNDSPGHCAKYCTYSLMDLSRNAIVAIECIDVRQANLISNRMEKIGFMKAMNSVQAVVTVDEVVTDANPSIMALMSKL